MLANAVMAENGENTTAVPPNSETNTVVETTEIMETLPVSEISQPNESNAMDIVSMALSNVTETSNLMTVVDSNVVATEDVEEVETVQQFEQIEVVEQQVVHEIPISNDMMITSADGQIILPSNSTPAELSAVETLVGGALQQTVLSQPTRSQQGQAAEPSHVAAVSTVAMTLADANSGPVMSVPVVESSNPGVVHLAGGAQGISASSLLGSIATMIDSTEASINSSNPSLVVGMKMNTTVAPTGNIVTRTVPANGNFVSTSATQGVTAIDIGNNVMNVTNNVSNTGATIVTNTTTLGLNSIINTPAQSTSSSLPSTITIKTPPGSNSVSQSLLNSILNNGDVQALLRRNPGQPITIVRVPEDSPGSGGKNVNKITVTTGTPAAKKSATQPPAPASKTIMRISSPVNKPSSTIIKSTNSASASPYKRKLGRPPKVKEPPAPPVVVKSKKTRSGRVSRPPIHRVRDYKTIHIQEMGDGDDEKEDFADYDGELLSQSQTDFPTYGGRPRSFKCDKCDKAYIGKGGLARHFKNNPSHGDPAELGVTYDGDEDAAPTSEHVTPLLTPRKRRGRPPLRPPNGDPDFHPNKRTPPSKTSTSGKSSVDMTAQALYRRKQRIQELMKTIGDEDLMELALPRLSKAITVWEFLLMKVEEAHLQTLPFQEILQQFESVRKHVKLFAEECLERISTKQEHTQATVNNQPEKDQDASAKTVNSELPVEKPEVDKGNPDDPQDRLGSGLSPDNQTERDKSSEVSPPDKQPETTPDEGTVPEAKTKQSGTDKKSSDIELNSKTPTDDNKSTESQGGASDSASKSTSENEINESRTGEKEADTSDNLLTEDQTQKSPDTSKSKSPGDDPKENAKPSTEASKDILDLDTEVAKVLGMEAGRYNVKEWTTTKLPSIYRFAKNITDDLDDSMSDEEKINDAAEEEPIPVKRQKMSENVVERPMPPMRPISNVGRNQTARQIIRMEVPRENNLPRLTQPPVTQPHPVLLTENKSALVSNSMPDLQTISGAGGAGSTSTAGGQPVVQKVVQQVVQVADRPQVVQHVEQTVQEPMEISGQLIEKIQEVIETKQEEEETEAVAYQAEEQGHSIVPEGSTIMQMEDGTFLVQKPDGTAMQIQCPEGMTIETIQALLSMDAGNILQASE